MQGSEQTPKAPLGNNARPVQNLHHRTVRTNIDFKQSKVRQTQNNQQFNAFQHLSDYLVERKNVHKRKQCNIPCTGVEKSNEDSIEVFCTFSKCLIIQTKNESHLVYNNWIQMRIWLIHTKWRRWKNWNEWNALGYFPVRFAVRREKLSGRLNRFSLGYYSCIFSSR